MKCDNRNSFQKVWFRELVQAMTDKRVRINFFYPMKRCYNAVVRSYK